MDLGLQGKRAIVCGASRGLGFATAAELHRAGVAVTVVARHTDTIEAAAERLRSEGGAEVTAVAADVATAQGRAAVLAAQPAPDILINNAGGPPSGDWRQLQLSDWQQALEANMLSAIALMQATLDGMAERDFGRVVNITSGSVKMPMVGLDLSNGARAGLTGFCRGIANHYVARNVTINNILPGLHETERLDSLFAAQAEARGVDAEQVRAAMLAAVPAGRFGTAQEFGAAAAFLCSANAGFITGQNLLLDGGVFPRRTVESHVFAPTEPHCGSFFEPCHH